jgi:tetraacyldisaccharide 4'-kinase
VYGQAARFRREWYERRPHLQRRLGVPVVSVGNLVVGGSGKTPVVVMLGDLLLRAGYAPAVISRGYKRRATKPAVTVVSNRESVIAGVDASGDEPQLLARRLPGVTVVVGVDRYDAGVVARDQLGADVLILDDGFQHLALARTVDLLLLSAADLSESMLPAGRLREPLDAARRADALLVPKGEADPFELARRVGVDGAFEVRMTHEPLRHVRPFGAPVLRPPQRVVAVAGIARPERFVDTLRQLEFVVARQLTFRDHHWFSSADLQRMHDAVRDTGAEAIVTTEKDAVRLEAVNQTGVPVLFLPVNVRVEPADIFASWLLGRIGPPKVRA